MTYNPNRRRGYATAVGTVLALAIGAGATALVLNDIRTRRCTSPPTISPLYPPGTTSSDRTKWPGIEVPVDPGTVPQSDNVELIIGFDGGDPDGPWQDSDPIDVASIGQLGKIALYIGPDQVRFIAYETAVHGSSACNTRPIVDFPKSTVTLIPRGQVEGIGPYWQPHQ